MGELRGLKEGKNIERIIADLEIDEAGWTNPKSLEIHYKFEAYLYLEEHISNELDKELGRNLYVKRTGPNKDDFLIDATKVDDYIWDKIILDEEDHEDNIYDPRLALINYGKDVRIKPLEKQIEEAVENQEFEKAAELKKELKIRDKIKNQNKNSQKPL